MTIRACILIAALAAAPAISTAQSNRQPDQVLYESGMSDIQHAHYERARLTLQTLLNTYDSSEFLSRAKLAIAESWYREGGTHGLDQAEAECKDFISFYSGTPIAAEGEQLLQKIKDKRAGKK